MVNKRQFDRFIQVIKATGGMASNACLRQVLGWSEMVCDAIRLKILREGIIVKGRGMGGFSEI